MMRKLADNRRIPVAAPAYLDRAGRPATPAETARHEFFRYGDISGPWHLRGPKGATARLAAAARLRVDDGDVVHDWAVAGLGIMLKSEVDVAEDISAAVLNTYCRAGMAAKRPLSPYIRARGTYLSRGV
jgi:DNA-binding transcriptional LysR family regulator